MKARNEGTNEVLKLLFLASFDHKTNAKIFNKKGFKRAIVLSPVFLKHLIESAVLFVGGLYIKSN